MAQQRQSVYLAGNVLICSNGLVMIAEIHKLRVAIGIGSHRFPKPKVAQEASQSGRTPLEWSQVHESHI